MENNEKEVLFFRFPSEKIFSGRKPCDLKGRG